MDLPKGVVVLTISMDLPFAQTRWSQDASVGHQILSSHRSEHFGRSYGVLIKQWRMLQRAVFVLDADRQLVHVNDHLRRSLAPRDMAGHRAPASPAVLRQKAALAALTHAVDMRR